MFVRKMLARALPLTALGLAAWCPAYAVEEPVKADDVYVPPRGWRRNCRTFP